MDHQLLDFLSETASETIIQKMEQASEVLFRFNQPTFEDDVEEELNTRDVKENVTTYQNIIGVFNRHLLNVINEFGITVEPGSENDLVKLVNLAQIIERLPTYGDPGPVLAILQKEEDAETRFAEVCALLDGRVNIVFTYLQTVESLNEALLTKLETILEQKMDEVSEQYHSDASNDLLNKKREQFSVYRQVRELIAEEALMDGYGFNTPLETLVSEYGERLEHLENTPEELAEEVVGLILLSDQHCDLKKASEELIEEFSKDINVTSKAQVRISNLIAEVQNDEET